MKKITIIFFLLISCAPAAAELGINSPYKACTILKDAGLIAGEWRNQYDQVFGCASKYRTLAGGNNLAYYVEGGVNSVGTMKLVLNVNDRAAAKQAHGELISTANLLSLAVTDAPLPEMFAGAIRSGSSIAGRTGAAEIEVIRSDWPTGKGYDLKVIYK